MTKPSTLFMKVRYTIADLRSNVKFIFLFSFFISLMLVVAQSRLMQLENRFQRLTQELCETEVAVSMYRDAIFLLHDDKLMASVELLSEIKKTQDALEPDGALAKLLGEESGEVSDHLYEVVHTRFNQMQPHDEAVHSKCRNYTALLRKLSHDFRSETALLTQSLRDEINLLNTIILALPVMIVALLVYSLFTSLTDKIE